MSEKEVSKTNMLFTFLGSLGAILVFALILFVAYLPNRPAKVDADVIAKRQETADAARATSNGKLEGYAVVNAEAGAVRIPIAKAMELTVKSYQSGSTD